MEKKYFTSVDACSCPDYQYRRGRLGQDCKHMAQLREAVEVVASHRARWAKTGREMGQDGRVKPRSADWQGKTRDDAPRVDRPASENPFVSLGR